VHIYQTTRGHISEDSVLWPCHSAFNWLAGLCRPKEGKFPDCSVHITVTIFRDTGKLYG